MIKTPDQIKDTPYKLPVGFTWSDIDLQNDEEVYISIILFYFRQRNYMNSC